MQTTTLPIQVSGAAPQRAAANAGGDAAEFRAALSRELEQRPQPAPPAPKAAARQPAQADNCAATDAKAPAQQAAQQAAQPADAKAQPKAGRSADAGAASQDGEAAGDHPATTQVTDMLALVASLNQPPQQPDAGAAQAAAAAALAGAGATQAAVLQGAVKALAKGSGEQPSGKASAAPGQLHNPAAAALGAAVGADTKAGQVGDLRAGRDAFAAQLKAQPDAAPARELLTEAAALKEPASALPLVAPAAALTVAQAAAAAPDRIAARVGSAAWDQQVGQKIVWMVAGDEQSASLTLNPPDLGPLQVVLSVTNDQASVAFSANQQEVRQALENALPRLREMLGESGIALGNATVDAGMPDGRQAQGGEQPRGGASSSRFDNGPAVADSTPRTSARVTTLGERGMVDTFA